MESNTPKYVFYGFVVLMIGALAAVGLHSRNQLPAEQPFVGSGSTFVSPLMVQWSASYERTELGKKIDYQSGGSGFGIKSILSKKVDFACTDAPLTDEQMAMARAAGGDIIHVPLILGAVVPAYNLPEVSEAVRFSGPVLADIYLGKIKKWDDDALKELNPKIKDELPKKEIVVVHRSDGSGTTYIWADYLSKVSPAWKEKVGVATDLTWPVGVAVGGNEGVAKEVKKTAWSIGYVELTYAFRFDLKMGLVRNREKEFIRAGLESVRAAADNGLADLPEDLRFSLTDPPGKGSFPICGATWAVVYVNQPGNKGRRLYDFLYWAVGPGQDEADLLLYVRMPESLNRRVVDQLKKIKVDE